MIQLKVIQKTVFFEGVHIISDWSIFLIFLHLLPQDYGIWYSERREYEESEFVVTLTHASVTC